jgi:hypothetical protein
MMIKNKFVICSVCIIVLTACIVSTGCTTTSPQGAQTIPPTITTSVQTLSPTTAPVIIATTVIPTTAPTAILSTTETPISYGLTVTLNSAVKKTSIGDNLPPKTGNVFIVLDVTIQNNDKNNDFKYTDSSFSLFDVVNQKRSTAITSKFTGGLNTPLTSGTIPLKSTKTGQIVFGVSDNSNSYKFAVVNSTSAITSLIDINVP